MDKDNQDWPIPGHYAADGDAYMACLLMHADGQRDSLGVGAGSGENNNEILEHDLAENDPVL